MLHSTSSSHFAALVHSVLGLLITASSGFSNYHTIQLVEAHLWALFHSNSIYCVDTGQRK